MADYLFDGRVAVRPDKVPGNHQVTFTIEKLPEETVKFFRIRADEEGHLTRQEEQVMNVQMVAYYTISVWELATQIVQIECQSFEVDTPMTTIFVISGGTVYNLTDQEWINIQGVETLLSPPIPWTPVETLFSPPLPSTQEKKGQ